MRASLRALAVLSMAAGCGSSSPPSDGTPGLCSAGVAAGQACNAIANVATAITPDCQPGALPVGAGGTITDGTYVLTEQTYYDMTSCPTAQLAVTIAIAGDCIQEVSGGVLPATVSNAIVVQGSQVTFTRTCLNIDATGVQSERADKTFTATASTFTVFTQNSTTGNGLPDHADVFTKQ